MPPTTLPDNSAFTLLQFGDDATICVQLADEGKEYLEKYFKNSPEGVIDHFIEKVSDSEGWIHLPFWEFMKIFGGIDMRALPFGRMLRIIERDRLA